MRFSIRQHRAGWSGHVGDTEIRFRRTIRWFRSAWTWTLNEHVYRLERRDYGARAQTFLNGELQCLGEVDSRFLPWQSKGIVWKCTGFAPLIVCSRRLNRRFRAVETEVGERLAVWRACGLTVEGVIRDRLTANQREIILGIIVAYWLPGDEGA